MPTGCPVSSGRFGTLPFHGLQHRHAPGPIVSWPLGNASLSSLTAELQSSSTAEDGHTNGASELFRRRLRGKASKRNPTRISHTPLVINALLGQGNTQWERYTGRKPSSVDFQYVSPFDHHLDRASVRPRVSQQTVQTLLATPTISHKSILAKYIETIHGPNDNKDSGVSSLDRVAAVFPPEARACLRDAGFEATDVAAWAWILSAKTSLQAAARLHAYSNRSLSQGKASTPTFLLQMILLRRQISGPALRLLMINSFDRLANCTTQDWRIDLTKQEQRLPDRCASMNGSLLARALPLMDQRPYPGLTETAVVVLAVRLIRHARKVWPELLPHIARLFTHYVVGHMNRKKIRQAQLCFVYNKILLLLSLPSNCFFKKIKHHQEAQMIVLRAMGEFDPPLLVDRTGYRAVVSVQLAHTKTPLESVWALQKAKSWPPWQEARLGMDEEVGDEAGISRAGMALSQLAEAGYRSMAWEEAAGILAGWGTDHSPTIQTRRYFPVTNDLGNSELMVWAARIRATRTVEEAWAIFLSHDDMSSSSPELYFAMAEKFLSRQRVSRSENNASALPDNPEWDPLPGDNPETFEAPKNPRERPYLRTPIPTIEQFLDHANQRGVDLGDRFLITVLEHSNSHELVPSLLRNSHLPTQVVDMVLGLAEPTASALKKVEDRLLLAILRWQTLHYSTNAVHLLGRAPGHHFDSTGWEGPTKQVLLAFKLVSVSQTTYSPAWTPLFRALTPPYKDIVGLALYRHSWLAMKWLITQMNDREIDRSWGQFLYLCRNFSLASIAALRIDDSELITEDWELAPGPDLLKTEFARLTGSQIAPFFDLQSPQRNGVAATLNVNSNSSSNTVMRLPDYTGLHMFIQSLGLAQNHEGILQVVKWLAAHQISVQTSDRHHSARRRARRCLIAVRVFLAGLWGPSGAANCKVSAAPEDIVNAARGIVEEIPGSGGWPTDEEVATYRPLNVGTHPESIAVPASARR